MLIAIIRFIVMTISYDRSTMMVIAWCGIGRISITMMVPIAETTDPDTNAASICTC